MTPRYQHITFRKLNDGEDFFSGKMRYYKASFFTGRAVLDGELIFVSPWRKVRSARPFGKQPPAQYPTELQTLTGKGPMVEVIAKGTNNVCFGAAAGNAFTTGSQIFPPQKVEGGDRTPETIGGKELTPSA